MKNKVLVVWGIIILLSGIFLLYSSVRIYTRLDSPEVQEEMKSDTEKSLQDIIKKMDVNTDSSSQHVIDKNTTDLTTNLHITSTRNMSIRMFFFALIYIVSGIGILAHKNWARLIFLSFMTFLLIYHMYQPLLAITKNAKIDFTIDVIIFQVLYALALLFIIHYFTRPKIKSFFRKST